MNPGLRDALISLAGATTDTYNAYQVGPDEASVTVIVIRDAGIGQRVAEFVRNENAKLVVLHAVSPAES